MGLFGVELGEYSLNGDQSCVCDWSLTGEITIFAHREQHNLIQARNNTPISSLDHNGHENMRFAYRIGLDHSSSSRNGVPILGTFGPRPILKPNLFKSCSITLS